MGKIIINKQVNKSYMLIAITFNELMESNNYI